MFPFISILGLVMLFSLILALILGPIKNRDGSTWAAVSFFFPPAVLLMLLLPRAQGPRYRRPNLEEEERRDYRRDGS